MGRHAIDLRGQRFGSLVVIARAGTANTGGHSIWKCECDCGTPHTVIGQSLRNGTSTRCPNCIKAGIPSADQLDKGTRVDLYFHANGETGGFAIAREMATGKIITHSFWNRSALGAQPWQGYGATRYVLKRLVRMGRVKAKASSQSIERWARHNAIVIKPHWFVTRPTLAKLWDEAVASGTGPELTEIERGDGERRVAAAMVE